MGEDRTGVLVMAHGTPSDPDEIESFYTRIRRGSPPSAEQLADLRRRYEAIGGVSPLTARTAAQVDGLAARLGADRAGRYLVAFGAKHADPSIEQAAATLAASGVRDVVGLVLTPHRSSMGSGEYQRRAAAALADRPSAPRFRPVEQWWDAPGMTDIWAEGVDAALAGLPGGTARVTVLFTAHSLPQRVVADGDPYPEQVAASAVAVAAAAQLGRRGIAWRVAWQSAGRTPEPWLGPDVLAEIAALEDTADAVVVCPVGFVSDHLEVLYDLDIEARQAAERAGLAFARTASLNDDPRFLAVLASVVEAAGGD
jgi:ferrochelatase